MPPAVGKAEKKTLHVFAAGLLPDGMASNADKVVLPVRPTKADEYEVVPSFQPFVGIVVDGVTVVLSELFLVQAEKRQPVAAINNRMRFMIFFFDKSSRGLIRRQ